MLENYVCIVTGGARGLGEATARHLGVLGATVVVNDLGTGPSGEAADEEPAREVAAAIREEG